MIKMKKCIMAAILICGASLFVSCVDASDNPVPAAGKYSITVMEGETVSPKVTVSPTLAAEGETVTLTAVKGYKFRRVEVDNAPVTTLKDGKLLINYSLLSAPFAWSEEGETNLKADELPGFKAITAEEAAQWVPTQEDKDKGAYLIYGFDKEGNALVYGTLFGADPVPVDPIVMTHLGTYNLSIAFRLYYTSSATVIGDKTKATFQMPAGNAKVDVDMVRDMSVDVTATMKNNEFTVKKDGNAYVLTEGVGMAPIQPDVYDEIGAPLVEMQESIDYILQLQKQGNSPDEWKDVKELSEGTFRWLLIGNDSYEGTITTPTFKVRV